MRVNVFGPVFGDDPKERLAASPVAHVRPGLPPFLLMSAERDLPLLPGIPLLIVGFKMLDRDDWLRRRASSLARPLRNSR